MSILIPLSQKFSPFQCCREPIHTKRQLNLYQTQLSQPLKVTTYNKPQTLQKMVHINNFYQAKQNSNNFKVVEKSRYDEFVQQCEKNHEMFVDGDFVAGEMILQGIEADKKIVWRRLSQIYNKLAHKVLEIDPESQQFITPSSKLSPIRFTPLKSSPSASILSLITHRPTILQQILRTPQQQLSNSGIYRLILNDHGCPKQVVIDDYVPLYMNTNQHLLVHPHLGQLWSVLLEKAIAKVVGSYGKLLVMKDYEILRLVTPAPTVKCQLHINDSEETLSSHIQTITNAIAKKHIICCTSKPSLDHKRIKPAHTYSIVEVQNSAEQPLIVLLDPLHDGEDTEISSVSSNKQSNISQPDTFSFRQVFKLKLTAFVKYFSHFCVCYFQQNFSMDFQRMQLQNRKAQYIHLQVQQQSDIILTFSRVKRKFRPLPLINLSQVTKKVRNIIGIEGGWLKMLVVRQKLTNQESQPTLEYVKCQIQTQDNTLSMHFSKLKAGQYVVYVEGYSEQNESEFHSFSVCSPQPFFLKRPQQQTAHKYQYFLQEVMLNHCLAARQTSHLPTNHFIPDDPQSWYVSNFLYQHGAFGYLVVYLSQYCGANVQVRIDLEKIQQEGYKLQCKKVVKEYKKLLKPGNADVVVFSLNYQSKRQLNTIEFPPKSVVIETFQNPKHYQQHKK